VQRRELEKLKLIELRRDKLPERALFRISPRARAASTRRKSAASSDWLLFYFIIIEIGCFTFTIYFYQRFNPPSRERARNDLDFNCCIAAVELERDIDA
jgi:hypothetical protein